MKSLTSQTELFPEYPERVVYESLLEVWFALVNRTIDPETILLSPEAQVEYERVERQQRVYRV
jgi:hypothetical protein